MSLQVPLKIDAAMPAKTTPKTSFGQRLFALRTARGYTQVSLAKALGTTQRVISYYETKGELPTPDFIVALVRTLGVTADELLGLKPSKIEHRKEDPKRRRLWKRFQRMASLPERDQRAVKARRKFIVTGASAHTGVSQRDLEADESAGC